MPARPSDRHASNDRVLAQTKMNHGLAAGHVPTREPQLTYLRAQGAFDLHGGTHAEVVRNRAAQVNVHTVARIVVVSHDGDAGLIVGKHYVNVAVAAQVAKGCAEAHALLVEAPCRSDAFEF